MATTTTPTKDDVDPRIVEWCRKLAPLAGAALGEMVACRAGGQSGKASGH